MTIWYLLQMGTSPGAYANSLAWFYKYGDETLRPDQVQLIGSKENPVFGLKGVKGELEAARTLIEKNFREFFGYDELPFVVDWKNIIEISEENVLEGSQEIVRRSREFLSTGDTIIFDLTAGRKAMSAASSYAALILHACFDYPVYVSYYWLLKYTTEYLKKPVWDLGIDDAASKIIDVADIAQFFREMTTEGRKI